MNKLFFWNHWPSPQKQLCQTFLILLMLSLVYYLVGYFWSAKLVIQWETVSQIKTLPLVLEQFNFGAVPLQLTADFYAITQVFQGSDLLLSAWPGHILITAMALGLILGLSLAPDLNRFWFLASQMVFIFIMVGFKLEQLLLFERTDKLALILVFILYLPAGYYFHIKQSVDLRWRILTFAVITALFVIVIFMFSGVSNPFLYLVNYGMVVPIAITVAFILFTAHEVIYGFLYLITRSNTPQSSNSFIHFFAISLIYLGNVLLLYLKNSRRIDWDFYYLDAFWIFITTSLIGFWGLKQRQELYKNIINFHPHAALGYLGMAVVSFCTVGYFFAIASDSTVEAFEDIIVFGQLSIGFLFLIYILFNFRTVLIENLKVYKVVYKPKKMPFFSMRLGGLIGALGLVLLADQYPLNQAINGYYNGIADLHRADNKDFLAKEYYKLASIYASTNHRSNYAIASMALQEQNYAEALKYFKQSLLKQPTAFAYVNTANLYQGQESFFQALFTLKEGLEDFPKNGHIINNLAMLYAQTAILDSARYFLSLNEGKKEVSTVTNTNQIALLMRSSSEIPLDSLFRSVKGKSPEEISNLLLYASKSQYTPQVSYTPPRDSIMNPLEFSWWYNHTLNQKPQNADWEYLKLVADHPGNLYYRDDLKFARAVSLYYGGKVADAFEELQALQYTSSTKSGYYNQVMGLWCLQQQAEHEAQEFFEKAVAAGHLPSLGYLALTSLSLGQKVEAERYWNSYKSNNPQGTLWSLDSLIQASVRDSVQLILDDEHRFWQLQFSDVRNTGQLAKEIAKIRDAEIASNASAWMLAKVESPLDYQQTQILEPLIATSDDQVKALRELQRNYFEGSYESPEGSVLPVGSNAWYWHLLNQAKMSESNNEQQIALTKYEGLLQNPFFAPGILAASQYYNAQGQPDQAYQVLLEAIEVNRFQPSLLMEYGRQCMRMNLDNYAEIALERLRDLVSPEQHQQIRQELMKLSIDTQQEIENWDS